jgi:small GTP-binding protein
MVARIKKRAKDILKICILGEGGVGKTTLTKRVITGQFDAATKMTIGIDFQALKTSIFDPTVGEDVDNPPTVDLNVQIWDFGGEERFRFILPRYCKGAVGGLLLYDLSRYNTTRYLEEWHGIWVNNAPKGAPIYLIGTKYDVLSTDDDRKNAEDAIAGFAKQLNIEKYYVISSKTGKNILMMINDLLKAAYLFNLHMIEAQIDE